MKEPIPKSARHFYSFGAFRLYVAERELFREGQPVTLPPKTFHTLLLLLRRHGHVVDKNELMKSLWPDTFVEEDSLGCRRTKINADESLHAFLLTPPRPRRHVSDRSSGNSFRGGF